MAQSNITTMKNSFQSSTKTQQIEIPVVSVFPPENETSENTHYTGLSSTDTGLLRKSSQLNLPGQDLSYDNLLIAEVGKETRKIGNCLELPQIQRSKSLVSFSDSKQAEDNSSREDFFPERSFKVSKLLQDRIRVLENEVQKHLTEAKEAIQEAEMGGKTEKSMSLGSASLGSVKSLQSRNDASRKLHRAQKQSTHKSCVSVKHRETAMESRLPKNRLPKIRSKSLTSDSIAGGILPSDSSVGKKYPTRRATLAAISSKNNNSTLNGNDKEQNGQVNVNFTGKTDKKQAVNDVRKEKQVISMLEITEKSLGRNDCGLEDKKLQNTLMEIRLPVPKSILKEPKNSATKPNNLTKAVNKTIQQLYKLNKDKDADNLSDLLESKLMAEKELKKAIKREQEEEREERIRQETKNIEKSRREAFFIRMEELERLEEEMRETRIRERERRREEARIQKEKNITLWNEKQKSILSSKISHPFKFSYFPLLVNDSRSSSSDDEQSSSEDSGRSSPDNNTSAGVSRQSSASTRTSRASSYTEKNWKQVIGCAHARKIRKLSQ